MPLYVHLNPPVGSERTEGRRKSGGEGNARDGVLREDDPVVAHQDDTVQGAGEDIPFSGPNRPMSL